MSDQKFQPQPAVVASICGWQFKTNDPAVLRALEGAMHKEPFRRPLALHVRGRQGEVPVFEARSLRDGRAAPA